MCSKNYRITLYPEHDFAQIFAFYEALLYNIESLQTLASLNKLDAAVSRQIDKLDVSSLCPMTTGVSKQFVEALEKLANIGWSKKSLTNTVNGDHFS